MVALRGAETRARAERGAWGIVIAPAVSRHTAGRPATSRSEWVEME